MKYVILIIWLLATDANQLLHAQNISLSTAEATDTLKRIFVKHVSDELIATKVITEMYFADAPSVRIDSMFYEVYSLKDNYYITIDHDISYLVNNRWNITIYRSQQSIFADSITDTDGSLSFRQNPFSIFESFMNNPQFQFSYSSNSNSDTARLTILTNEPDEFNEIRLFYSKTDGSLFRGEYLIPVPEMDNPLQSPNNNSSTHQTTSMQNREYLMKMYYSYEENTPTNGALFSESNFFVRNPDGTYSASPHFSGFRVIRRENEPGN
jgi:hypothetical protein